MALDNGIKPATLCAESIALLFLLHPVASLPHRNKLETPKHHVQGYVLSFGEEQRVTESLAYLSNDSEDANHIPAVCIEQRPTTSSLNVLLAANSGNGQDQHLSLQRIKSGLQTIFATLPTIEPQEGRSRRDEDAVFDAIVSMCSKRILLRLRLMQKNRGSHKQTIKQMLSSTIGSLQGFSKNKSEKWRKFRDLFIKNAKAVNKAADAWSKHQTNERLGDLVDSIYCLKQAVDIGVLLDGMTTRDMNPTMRKSVVNTMNKVARYREIARSLSRLSRKNALLRNLRVITVDLPLEAFRRLPKAYTSSGLRSFLPKVYHAPNKAKAKQSRLLIQTEDVEVNQQFARQVQKSLNESKVHAEIQILYYLELHSSELPPRVVASYKDACFLCNAFISMHGKMHTTRTHGRLYPGWRLPSFPALVDLEQRFNRILASQITASITTLLSRGQKTLYPDPNESTLLTLPHSTSTVCTYSGAKTDAKRHLQIEPTHRTRIDEMPIPTRALSLSEDKSEIAPGHLEQQVVRGDKEEDPEGVNHANAGKSQERAGTPAGSAASKKRFTSLHLIYLSRIRRSGDGPRPRVYSS